MPLALRLGDSNSYSECNTISGDRGIVSSLRRVRSLDFDGVNRWILWSDIPRKPLGGVYYNTPSNISVEVLRRLPRRYWNTFISVDVIPCGKSDPWLPRRFRAKPRQRQLFHVQAWDVIRKSRLGDRKHTAPALKSKYPQLISLNVPNPATWSSRFRHLEGSEPAHLASITLNTRTVCMPDFIR